LIAFLTLCYCAIVWLVFFKLKLLPWNRGTQGGAVAIGILGILALVISMNLFQPYSKDVRIYRHIIQIVPRVTGRVIEVPVRPNSSVERGAPLFRVDPEPFQHEVDRLSADLRLKKVVLEDARALTGAKVAAEIKLDRAQAAHDQTLAMLENAKWQLRETTVYSPVDGVITNLALQPGQVASQMASLPVMTVIDTADSVIIATLSQSALAYVAIGDPVEVALERLPGRILTGRIEAIIPATGQGQLPPGGALMEWTQQPIPGHFAVRVRLDEPADAIAIEAGASGVAAVYTERGKAIRIIRKVVIRMTTWLNYIIL
jgi:RND family efflux transporter MFP subunit